MAATCWALRFLLIHAMINEIESASPRHIQSILTEKLLSEYGPTTVLPVDATNQTLGFIDLVILQVIDLNERHQTLQMSTIIHILWHDDYLTWNTTTYPGVSYLVLPAVKIWSPDVHLLENVDSNFEIPKDVSVKVEPSGWVLWTTQVILYTACRIDAGFFPFDKQQCDLRFDFWNYESDQLQLLPWTRTREQNQERFFENGVWHLQDVQYSSWDTRDRNSSDVVFRIHLHRRPLFHVLSFIIPCGLLSVLNMLTFVLPTQSGEKVSFGITNLLALVLYQQLISDSLPPSAIEIPILRYYFTPMILIGCLSIVDGVVVAVLYHHDGTKPVPKWLRFFTKVGAPRSVTTLQPIQTVNEKETLLSDSTSKQTTMKALNINEISPRVEKQRDAIPTTKLGNAVDYTSNWQQVAAVVDHYFLALGLLATITSITITVILFLTSDEGNDYEVFEYVSQSD